MSGAGAHGPIVWLYHRVAVSHPDPFALCVDPATFERQVEYLVRRCNLLSLADLIAARTSGACVSRGVALTFDDGYADNLTTASPVLQRAGAPATFFVTTGALDRPAPFWWDVLTDLVLSSAELPATLTLARLPSGGRSWSTDMPREHLLRHIHAAIYRLPAESRDDAITALSGQVQRDSGVDIGARPMSAEEIAELNSRPGHQVESHTVSHLSLPEQSPEHRRRELVDSRATLERILERSPSLLAYPFGAWSLGVCHEARNAGYDAAVAAGGGPWRPDSDRMALPRIEAPNSVQQLIDITEATFAGAP